MLVVSGCSTREGGRPVGRKDSMISFQEECASLRIPSDALTHFFHAILSVNLGYHSTLDIAEDKLADPICDSRRTNLQNALDMGPMIVYKRGASTDLTLGRFIKIRSKPPKGWYGRSLHDLSSDVDDDDDNNDDNDNDDEDDDDEDDDDNEDDEDDDDGNAGTDFEEWLGYVEWLPHLPFTAPGGLGAMGYAMEGGIKIPLGIHIGAPASNPNHSVFVSLETFLLRQRRRAGHQSSPTCR